MTNPAIFSCTSSVFALLSAEILRLGKSLRFQAHGSSMQPLLRDGDLLLVQPAEPGTIKVSDVVLCSSGPDHLLVHRVVLRQSNSDGDRFLVQGDQVAQPDGWIPQAQVYGRVVALERAGVHIEMNHPVMRLLGWLVVLRSRGPFGRLKSFRAPRRLVKRLPVFYRYLV